ALGRRVVGLAEVHDVDAVRTERRAHRGRGRRLSRRDLDPHDRGKSFLRHLYCSASTALRLRAFGAAPSSLAGAAQSLATWPSSSSTGVSRPKMFTRTVSFDRA